MQSHSHRLISLSKAQIDEFYEQGWLKIPDVFDSSEITQMRESFDSLVRMALPLKTTQLYKGSYFVLGQANEKTIIHRIVWCGAAEPILLKFGGDQRLLKMAGAILGCSDVQQLINQAHFKIPGDGVEFPWHQDIQHRSKREGDWTDVNGRGSYVQMVLALDDMTENNGPLKFIPGSHKSGKLDLGGDGYESPTRTEMLNTASAVSAEARSGSVVLFGPYTVHGSFPNQSSTPRRVFINGFAYPGANRRIYPGEGSGRILHVP